MLTSVKNVLSSTIVGQLAVTAAKTTIICGIVFGSGLVASKMIVGNFFDTVAKTVGEKLAENKK